MTTNSGSRINHLGDCEPESIGRRSRGGAPRGNRNALKHGGDARTVLQARLIARGRTDALIPLADGAEGDMIIDWAGVLSINERAFSTRVSRLGTRLATLEGLKYPGLNGLPPLARISLIALQGLMDSIEARQMYALNLRQQRDPHYFDQQYRVGIDIGHARRLEKHVIEGLHAVAPVGAIPPERLMPKARRA